MGQIAHIVNFVHCISNRKMDIVFHLEFNNEVDVPLTTCHDRLYTVKNLTKKSRIGGSIHLHCMGIYVSDVEVSPIIDIKFISTVAESLSRIAIIYERYRK